MSSLSQPGPAAAPRELNARVDRGGGSPIPDPTGRDPDELALARAALADARARLDAVGEVLAAEGCDCPCDCGRDHDDDCERCLGCRVERVAFGRGKRW